MLSGTGESMHVSLIQVHVHTCTGIEICEIIQVIVHLKHVEMYLYYATELEKGRQTLQVFNDGNSTYNYVI